MLYKYLFSILCGHLNLNQKRKKFEFDRLPVKPTGYQSNRPVSRSEPIEHVILNLILNLISFHRFSVKPVRPGSGLVRYQTGPNSKFKFKFKKMKNSQNIPKNTSRCDESNGVKFSQKFVHLV